MSAVLFQPIHLISCPENYLWLFAKYVFLLDLSIPKSSPLLLKTTTMIYVHTRNPQLSSKNLSLFKHLLKLANIQNTWSLFSDMCSPKWIVWKSSFLHFSFQIWFDDQFKHPSFILYVETFRPTQRFCFQNYMKCFLGYFDPENIFLDDGNK